MESWKEKTFIPFNKRKKILLLSDDLRLPSGIGVMSKEIVFNTLHHFNWFQLGAAIKHFQAGKIVDVGKDLNNKIGENYMKIMPNNGYGNPDILRWLIQSEKPDAILHFTDPRFWIWLYQMEHEVRTQIPIFFYHIWDDLPFPYYNEPYYESCDWIGGISKQTYNIVKNVSRFGLKDWQLSYIPHGIDEMIFKPLSKENPGNQIEREVAGRKEVLSEYEEFLEFRNRFFGDKDFKFIVLYNNRNIRRKMPGDIILAFKTFVDMLPEDEKDKVVLLLHTHPIDDAGTDLVAIKEALAKNYNIVFSTNKIPPHHLNYMYNMVDVTINISSNEGFGLSTAESLMAGTPIIANVTGGLQDQMGFVDDEGEYLKCDKHFNGKWGSNHDGKYKKCGVWAYPIFPSTRSLMGSVPTPYIFDDRVRWEDAAKGIHYWYTWTKDERKKRGLEGRKYLLNENIQMSSKMMGLNFIKYMDAAIENWKPKERFKLYNNISFPEIINTGINKVSDELLLENIKGTNNEG